MVFARAEQATSQVCVAVCGGGVIEGKMPLAQLSSPCYPEGNWALLVLIPRWVGLCMFQDPVGLSNELSCEARSFSCCHNPHRFLQPEVLGAFFPLHWNPDCMVCLIPLLFSWFVCTQMWVHPVHQLLPCPPSPLATALPRILSTLAARLHPSCQSE